MLIKKFILCLLVIFVSYSIVWALDVNWRTVKSTHFIAYYKNAPEDFIGRLIEKSEEYYNKIADDLGFRRYNFWLWDNRAKIYIYDNAKDYQTFTGQPSWSSGCAIIRDKIIHTFPYAKEFFDTVLPHEMGHLIFREFVGFNNNAVPVWLDEGVASYQENLRHPMANRRLREAINTNRLIDLEGLSGLSPHSIQNTELVNLFYAEAVSIIDYLIKEFGKDNFVSFCQALRDKRDLERAIASVYPFRNIQELDQAWQKYIQK